MLESLEAGRWWEVGKDVTGQYYDLLLFYGCRCGVSTAARLKNTVRQQHITQTNTVHTIHPQPNLMNHAPKWQLVLVRV